MPRTGKREAREHAWTSTGTRPAKSPRAKRLAFRPEGAESWTKKTPLIFRRKGAGSLKIARFPPLRGGRPAGLLAWLVASDFAIFAAPLVICSFFAGFPPSKSGNFSELLRRQVFFFNLFNQMLLSGGSFFFYADVHFDATFFFACQSRKATFSYSFWRVSGFLICQLFCCATQITVQ